MRARGAEAVFADLAERALRAGEPKAPPEPTAEERLAARALELDEMLAENDEERVGPWFSDGVEIWCDTLRHEDGKRVGCTAFVAAEGAA